LSVILHTLNASPASAAFSECLALLEPGDAVLLLGDGVYAALAGTASCTALEATGAEIFVLESDARAAGLLGRLQNADVLDMDGFVALSERLERQMSWY
jgi:tRNA 2-thiouridine synthesizing protein B